MTVQVGTRSQIRVVARERRLGTIVRNAGVVVTNVGTGAAATVYSDEDLTTVITSLVTDGSGVFSFYAPPGTYSISFTGSDAFEAVENVHVVGDDTSPTGTYAFAADFAAAAAGAPAQRLITDSDVVVKTGTSTSAATLRRTERSRRLLVVVNLGAEAVNVVEGTLDSTTIPSSGYTSVAVGSEWVTTSALPVFAYFPTTQSTVRVYCELEG